MWKKRQSTFQNDLLGYPMSEMKNGPSACISAGVTKEAEKSLEFLSNVSGAETLLFPPGEHSVGLWLRAETEFSALS